MEQRNQWVDYAKAIGILLVVYGHVARGLYNAGIAIPEKTYALADSIVYSFHMPLFFFLSGLFFYQSLTKRGGRALIASKIDTIAYPYILWSLLQGSIEVFLSSHTNSNIHMNDVLALFWSPRAQFWYLYALFVVFIVSTVLYKMAPKHLAAQVVTPLLLLAASLLYIFPQLLPKIFIFRYIANDLVFFVLGIFFTQLAHKTDFLGRPVSLVLLTTAVIAYQYYFHVNKGFTNAHKGLPLLLLASLTIIWVVSLAKVATQKYSKTMLFIGASSMGIYLMHIVAGSGARVLLKALGIYSYSVHLWLGCALAVLGPLAALYFIKRFKIPLLFSAPISQWAKWVYCKCLTPPHKP